MEPKQVSIKLQKDGSVLFENIRGTCVRGRMGTSTKTGKFSKRYIRSLAKTLMEIGSEHKTSPMDPVNTKGAYIIGTHPYTFRCGKPALITGVKNVWSETMEPRVCYEIVFPDGVIDYVPMSAMNDYEIKR
jgi:hypothetical protein